MPGVAGDRFGSVADGYAAYRKGFPVETLDLLARNGVGLAGQRVVDLGCGTGTLARRLAARGAPSRDSMWTAGCWWWPSASPQTRG